MSDPDRRKVWFSETLALGLGASLVTWGEPDEDGFYNPVLTRAATPAPLDVTLSDGKASANNAKVRRQTIAATPAPLAEWQQGYDAGYKEGQEDANLIAPTPLAPGPRAIVDGCICQKCADRGDECDYGAEPNHDECSLCERGRHVRERDREDEMEQES